MKNTYDGIDQLRLAVRLFDNCNETFNQRFTGEELLTLWRMYRECGWDIPPDRWSNRQVREALGKNVIPQFTDEERPFYPNDPIYRVTAEGETKTVSAEEFWEDNAVYDELQTAILALKVGESHTENEWSLERVS
jgi:hypothetical protein